MSEHKNWQHGRTAQNERIESGRDATEQEGIASDPMIASEEAREISRILDHEEGYDRAEPKHNPGVSGQA